MYNHLYTAKEVTELCKISNSELRDLTRLQQRNKRGIPFIIPVMNCGVGNASYFNFEQVFKIKLITLLSKYGIDRNLTLTIIDYILKNDLKKT